MSFRGRGRVAGVVSRRVRVLCKSSSASFAADEPAQPKKRVSARTSRSTTTRFEPLRRRVAGAAWGVAAHRRYSCVGKSPRRRGARSPRGPPAAHSPWRTDAVRALECGRPRRRVDKHCTVTRQVRRGTRKAQTPGVCTRAPGWLTANGGRRATRAGQLTRRQSTNSFVFVMLSRLAMMTCYSDALTASQSLCARQGQSQDGQHSAAKGRQWWRDVRKAAYCWGIGGSIFYGILEAA